MYSIFRHRPRWLQSGPGTPPLRANRPRPRRHRRFQLLLVPERSGAGYFFSPWSPFDVRDGRVLLESRHCFRRSYANTLLAVCNPLSRRYVLLPPIPVELYQHEKLHDFQHTLAPIGEDEDETSFRVICWANYNSKMVTFVFSSATGQWCIAASSSWSSLGIVDRRNIKYSRSCFYWMARLEDNVLVMDTRTMEVTAVNILTCEHMQLINLHQQSKCTCSIAVPTEGALGMFTVVADCSPNGSFYLYHTTQQINDGSCQLKNVIPLPRRCRYTTVGAAEGFVFIRGIRDQARLDDNAPLQDLFSLEVKTSQLKKVYGPAPISKYLHSYFGFPPSLSKPSL